MKLDYQNGPPKMAIQSNVGPHYYTAGDSATQWIREISRDAETPSYILERLSISANADVRMAVADHPNTPLEVLWLLSVDLDADVRFSLAENHNLDTGILNEMTKDSNPYVASRAERTLSRLSYKAS